MHDRGRAVQAFGSPPAKTKFLDNPKLGCQAKATERGVTVDPAKIGRTTGVFAIRASHPSARRVYQPAALPISVDLRRAPGNSSRAICEREDSGTCHGLRALDLPPAGRHSRCGREPTWRESECGSRRREGPGGPRALRVIISAPLLSAWLLRALCDEAYRIPDAAVNSFIAVNTLWAAVYLR